MDKNINWPNIIQPQQQKLQKVISHNQSQQPSRPDLKKIVQNYEFWLGNIITRNQSSEIYYGINKNTQLPVAIKVIPIQKSLTSRQRYDMENQIKLCKSIGKNSNVVTVYDTFSTANNYYVMMQKCQGNLKTLLLKKKVLGEEQVVEVMLDVLQGLRHLTVNNYVHCNIKPSNILIAQDGTAKLTDFALTRKLPTIDKPTIQPNQWTPYMSPLTLITKQYDQNNDIWALAVTMYECLHGYHNYPWKFQNYSDLLQKVYDGGVEYNNRKVSKEMMEFLGKLLNGRSKVSLGVMEVLADPFVKMHLKKREMNNGGKGGEQQPPKLFKNFSNNNNNSISPQKPLSQDHYLKYSAQISLNKLPTKNTLPFLDPNQQLKRHVSNYQTSSSPHKPNLRNQFTFVQSSSTQQRKISIREILDCQVSFMRFINIVLKQDENGYIVERKDNRLTSNNGDLKLIQMQEKKEIDHQLFRFVLIKQALGQKDWLKRTLEQYQFENPFGIDGIDEFLGSYQNRETIKNFRNILKDYDKKYLPLEQEMQRLITEISQKLSKIKCEWRPKDILTTSLQRKEILPILGVRLSRQLCKHIWHEIANGYTLLQTKAQNNETYRNQIIAQMEEKARRVDFLMTYYILNCLLIDNFSAPEHFVRNSGLHIIMNNKPTKMELDDFRLVEEKLRLLQII